MRAKNSIEMYNSSSGHFVLMNETTPHKMYRHSSVKFSEDTFYVIGGALGLLGPGKKVCRWQIVNAWTTPLAPLLEKRSRLGCALVPSHLEIADTAGRTINWGQSKTVEIYNIASDQWRYGSAVLPGDVWTWFTLNNTVWALGDAPGMMYWYNYDGDQWIHEIDIILKGVPEIPMFYWMLMTL